MHPSRNVVYFLPHTRIASSITMGWGDINTADTKRDKAEQPHIFLSSVSKRFHFLSSMHAVSWVGSLVCERKENYTGLRLRHGCWHEIPPPPLPWLRNCLIPGIHQAAAPPAALPPEWSAKQTGKLQAAVHIRPSLGCLFVGCCVCNTLGAEPAAQQKAFRRRHLKKNNKKMRMTQWRRKRSGLSSSAPNLQAGLWSFWTSRRKPSRASFN